VSEPIRRVPLVKAHAYGNDFLLVRAGDVHKTGISDLAELARRACDRHRGVGADGLLIVEAAGDAISMRLLNADGSPSELSGNGVRCVGAWVAADRSLVRGAALTVDTDAGGKRLELLEAAPPRFTFRSAMGRPEGIREERLDVAGHVQTVVVLRVGNPQCVVLGRVSERRLHEIAAPLAVHPFFPEGTNVELAEVEAPNRVRILIWERGVGPTTSSGTGACAAAVAAAALGGADRTLDVVAPGGTQRVEWTDAGIILTGWAEVTATVEWHVGPAEGG
jgi:diaminopimelate epimerase